MRSLQDGRGGGAPGAGWPAAGGAGRARAVLFLVVALTLAPTGAAQALPPWAVMAAMAAGRQRVDAGDWRIGTAPCSPAR